MDICNTSAYLPVAARQENHKLTKLTSYQKLSKHILNVVAGAAHKVQWLIAGSFHRRWKQVDLAKDPIWATS